MAELNLTYRIADENVAKYKEQFLRAEPMEPDSKMTFNEHLSNIVKREINRICSKGRQRLIQDESVSEELIT